MKTYNMLFSILRPAAFALLAAGLASCEADPVELEGGNLPSDRPGTPVGALYSTRSSALETDINIFADGDVTEKLVYRLTAPVDHDVTVTLEALDWDLETCQEWNLANGYGKYDQTDKGEPFIRGDDRYPNRVENFLVPFPVSKLNMPDGVITIPAGEICSAEIPITFKTEGIVKYFNYLLPLRVKTVTGVDPIAEEQIINMRLKHFPHPSPVLSWPEGLDISKLPSAPFTTQIGYVDVSKYKPTVACVFYIEDKVSGPWFQPISDDFYRAFEIVNLVKAEIKPDKEDNRALLVPTNDLKYVLKHDKELLEPLRQFGIKICISIQGGKTGLGFCNMDDTQIGDFALQVKTLCDQYDLAGINLWDKGSGYGREGMPETNTSSYPKLIAALREALGTNKLITVVDSGEPTATFHDVSLSAGIEVGKLIDFVHEGRSFTLTDPWDPTSDRKAFAGLEKDKYGTFYKAELAPITPNEQQLLSEATKTYAEKTGLTKVGATDINAFLHTAETEMGKFDGWYFNIFRTLNMSDFSGRSVVTMQNETYVWGQYANNYYYKDWD